MCLSLPATPASRCFTRLLVDLQSPEVRDSVRYGPVPDYWTAEGDSMMLSGGISEYSVTARSIRNNVGDELTRVLNDLNEQVRKE